MPTTWPSRKASISARSGSLSTLDSIQIKISNAQSKFASTVTENGESSIERKVNDRIPRVTNVGTFDVYHNANASFMSMVRTACRKQTLMAIRVDEAPDK
ncbi:hypothetical protein CRG98_046514 [Punica granatum]|uniref:Uncharacterized protein n=1 Tax=Punica granatum TaxID=22663 RepID=A0A2I0HMX1_PUNGR|nr:hypothetical protein CRG98_046514 [Punica granatum]